MPFSVPEVVVFKLLGVGIVQARLPVIVSVALTAAALTWGLRAAVRRFAATFAGLAFGCSGPVILYGRLAFLEDLVVLGLTLGLLAFVSARPGFRNGLLAGLCWAAAIGTKPSAFFPVAGILIAIALVWAWRDSSVRRWLAGTVAAIGVSGLLWLALVYLPNREAVAADVTIWPHFQWTLDPVEALIRVRRYVAGANGLYGIPLLPLICLAGAGTLAIVALRRRLTAVQARLAVTSFAWAFFGFGALAISSYRPNRYAVPLVPALAVLAAIGLKLSLDWLRERRAASAPEGRNGRGWIPRLVAAAAVIVAVAPGLAWQADVARRAEYRMVAIQNQFHDSVPAGERVAGSYGVVLFLMRSEAITIRTGLANNGDLYAQGVCWYLLSTEGPKPAWIPDQAWANRQATQCAEWRGETLCLYRLE